MTIVYTPSRAATLAAADESNNPFVTGAPFTGTYSTVAATETESADNAFSGTTFDPWVATITATTAQLRIDFGSAVEPTFAAIAAHNLGTLGGAVRVRHSDDASTYTTAGAGIVSPTDNQAIGFRLDDGAHRYWQFFFSGLSASDVLSVGVAWIGEEIILPQRFYQGYTPPLTPTQVDLRTNVSQGAQLLGSAYAERGSTFTASVQHVEDSFIRGADWLAFQQRWNRGLSSFWAWRPTKYGDLFYAWRSQGSNVIAPTNSGPKDRMGLTISGRVYHDD